MFEFLKKRMTSKEQKTAAIVVAAGNSTRMGENVNKQFIEIFEKPVVAYALEALELCPAVDEIVVVCREKDIVPMADILRDFSITKATNIIPGGETRQQSVQKGLNAIEEADYILIHDGARPCILPEEIQETIERAKIHGGAALGCKAVDTLKTVNADGMIIGTVDRSSVWQVQTPQVFRSELIREAYKESSVDATDDCMLVEAIGGQVCMVEGTSANLKITTNNDVFLAMAILQSRFE